MPFRRAILSPPLAVFAFLASPYSPNAEADVYIRTIPNQSSLVADGATEYRMDVVVDTMEEANIQFVAAQWGVKIPAGLNWTRAQLPDETNNPSTNQNDFFRNLLMASSPHTQPFNWIHSSPVPNPYEDPAYPFFIDDNIRDVSNPAVGNPNNVNKILGSYCFTVSPSSSPGTGYTFGTTGTPSLAMTIIDNHNNSYKLSNCPDGPNCLVQDDYAFSIIPVGDMNMDGAITIDDIQPFVESLLDPVTYQAQRQAGAIGSADMNGDGNINSRDIQLFVQKLLEQ